MMKKFTNVVWGTLKCSVTNNYIKLRDDMLYVRRDFLKLYTMRGIGKQ